MDERIGLAEVSAGRHDRKPVGTEGRTMWMFSNPGTTGFEFAFGMFGARDREPVVAVAEAASAPRVSQVHAEPAAAKAIALSILAFAAPGKSPLR